MSFGLGISFGRWCRVQAFREMYERRQLEGSSDDITEDRRYENEDWLVIEAHYTHRPPETVLMVDPAGRECVMTNKLTMWIRKGWDIDYNAACHKDSIVVLGKSG